MNNGSYKQSLLETLLKTPGYISDVARRLVELVRESGETQRCEYCGIELCATQHTTAQDLEKVYCMKAFERRIRGSPGFLQWQGSLACQ